VEGPAPSVGDADKREVVTMAVNPFIDRDDVLAKIRTAFICGMRNMRRGVPN